MSDLGKRDRHPEVMDDPNLNLEEHHRALKGLERINFWSRTGSVFWQSLPKTSLRILDIACGAGNLSIELAQRAKKAGLSFQVDGADRSPAAIEWAQRLAAQKKVDVNFFKLDICTEEIPRGYDIIITSLFFHHLGKDQAVSLIQRMVLAANRMILVDDLERCRLGYFLAFAGTRILTRSKVVHIDSLLSVRAAFNFYYGWDPEKIVANGLFADGSAALVATAGHQIEDKHWKLRASGAHIFPDSQDAMKWGIGDFGFEMELSPELPQLIASHLRSWLEDWLAGQNLEIKQIRSWAVHPGGPRILQAVRDSLGLSEEALAVSKEVLMEYGNMSSPALLFILDRLQKKNAPLPCIALGFGPGLAIEAALFL